MNPATFFPFGNWKHKSLHSQAAVTQIADMVLVEARAKPAAARIVLKRVK
jgi:hypothetical protein